MALIRSFKENPVDCSHEVGIKTNLCCFWLNLWKDRTRQVNRLVEGSIIKYFIKILKGLRLDVDSYGASNRNSLSQLEYILEY